MLFKKIAKIKNGLKQRWVRKRNAEKVNKIIKEACKSQNSGLKILFGPGFNISPGFSYHDILLASTLTNKGARIHYMSCQHHFTACSIFGGVWQHGRDRQDACSFCTSCDEKAVKLFSQFADTSELDDYVSDEKIKEIENIVSVLSSDELTNYIYNGIHVGHSAMNTVRNMHMVSEIKLVREWEKEVRGNLITNIAFVDYYRQVIEKYKPDRIISHDAFYSPWSMLFEMAKIKKIPFYNYYAGLRRGTWVYVKNGIAMDLNMEPIWKKVKSKTISSSQRKKIVELLKARESGNINLMKQFRDEYRMEEHRLLEKFINSGKPTAVLYTNVVWDLAALEKETIYPTIKEAYLDTVRYFTKHPKFQLIIKTHPDEENPSFPKTIEQVHKVIEKEFPNLPENIMILKTRSVISAYKLFKFTKLSIVYTTTAGLESVIFKVPAITLGNGHYRNKGFTLDPLNKKDYYEKIGQVLLKGIPHDKLLKQAELALKYFYYFQYVFFMDTNMVLLSYDGRPDVVCPDSLSNLISNNEVKNIIDRIVNGDNIMPLKI